MITTSFHSTCCRKFAYSIIKIDTFPTKFKYVLSCKKGPFLHRPNKQTDLILKVSFGSLCFLRKLWLSDTDPNTVIHPFVTARCNLHRILCEVLNLVLNVV